MKSVLLVCSVALLLGTGRALQAQTGLKTLAIAEVTTNRALVPRIEGKGKALEMGQVIPALRSHLHSAFQRSGKFTLTEDADVGVLFEKGEIRRNTGIFDAKTAPKAGKMIASEYLLLIEVDHFMDSITEAKFADSGHGYRRRMQVAGLVKIVDGTTGKTLDSSPTRAEVVDAFALPAGEVIEKERLDELIPKLYDEFALRVVQTTQDYVYPMKVMLVEDGVVSINRGPNSGLSEGDTLKVLGPTREVKDEDSGEVLKLPGAELGKVTVTLIGANFTQAKITEEKTAGAIKKGCQVYKQTSATSGGK